MLSTVKDIGKANKKPTPTSLIVSVKAVLSIFIKKLWVDCNNPFGWSTRPLGT